MSTTLTDLELIEKSQSYFLTKKRVRNDGYVPKYYVKNSHPAIIDKEMWEAVQLEMDRRRNYALENGIQKLEYATTDNPFAGRVICGSCGRVFGRKVWNSTSEKLRRIVWQCNGKYLAKGEKGCGSRHIDDAVLYQAFVDVFNAMVEQKSYFLEKWQKSLASNNVLVQYKARQFIRILAEARAIKEFSVDLYFALTEKIMVCEDGRLMVSLLDGTDIKCEIE